MSYSSYEAKENTPEGFRALVVTMCEQGGGRVDFVTADDETHVIGLDDLAFLVRAAASLPRHVLEPDMAMQPQPIAEAAPLEQVEQPTSKQRLARAGGRWTDEEEAQLRGLYLKGIELPEISAKMDRSPAAIVSRLLAMDLVIVSPNPNA